MWRAVLLYLWQLPQNLLGGVLILCTGAKKRGRLKGAGIYAVPAGGMRFGVSLGIYIILSETDLDTRTIRHEYGHCLQSRLLGPFYLIVVGIPSAVFNNLWDRLFHRKWTNQARNRWYYSRFPEKQADRLGGVGKR
ncbi:MAG: hypothetical protein LBS64_03410 [Spirochaetaceae bacterium]|jgi:hypothetical protein|nr:hypothetical protein [Spirochaetaceae bacterium]